MEKFVARENVRRYRHTLENGVDKPRRETILQLLLDEENELGHTREQLAKLDNHIARLSVLMARQVELIDNLRTLGHNSNRAELILTTLNDLMATYIAHRRNVAAALRH